jgi:hypothetical protein
MQTERADRVKPYDSRTHQYNQPKSVKQFLHFLVFCFLSFYELRPEQKALNAGAKPASISTLGIQIAFPVLADAETMFRGTTALRSLKVQDCARYQKCNLLHPKARLHHHTDRCQYFLFED